MRGACGARRRPPKAGRHEAERRCRSERREDHVGAAREPPSVPGTAQPARHAAGLRRRAIRESPLHAVQGANAAHHTPANHIDDGRPKTGRRKKGRQCLSFGQVRRAYARRGLGPGDGAYPLSGGQPALQRRRGLKLMPSATVSSFSQTRRKRASTLHAGVAAISNIPWSLNIGNWELSISHVTASQGGRRASLCPRG